MVRLTNDNLLPAMVLCRTFTYVVRVHKVGNLTNTVSLTNKDTDSTNDRDKAPITVLGTCSNPYGDGTPYKCPYGSMNIGPADRTINDISEFVSSCCVSCWGGTLAGADASINAASGVTLWAAGVPYTQPGAA